MVCAGDRRLSYLYSLDYSTLSRTSALARRILGFLDGCFRISTHLADGAAQSRLAIAELAAGPGKRYPVPLRDLSRGRKTLAQTLRFQRLFYPFGGPLAGDYRKLYHPGTNSGGGVHYRRIFKPVPHLGAPTWKPY